MIRNWSERRCVLELGVSLVPEGRRLFRDMTTLENLELGGYIGRARKVKEEHLEWVFQMFPVLKHLSIYEITQANRKVTETSYTGIPQKTMYVEKGVY